MACLGPASFPGRSRVAEPTPSPSNGVVMNGATSGNDGKNVLHKEVHEARKGLLRAMWQASVAPRFSSKPIGMEDFPTPTVRDALISSSNLTSGERTYLEDLLKSSDLESIRYASKRLSDKELFPPAEDPPEGGESILDATSKYLQRRDSEVQQHLFRLHEQTTVKPSVMLKRLSFSEGRPRLDPPGCRDDEDNSIMQGEDEDGLCEPSGGSDDDARLPEEVAEEERILKGNKKWNPFVDVNSWIDGNQGVEVDNDGNPAIPTPTSNPFKILGTSADDTSCHPHVLSPPLMEGLQGFMPESLFEHHYWLKYSLVRDGPNLMTMLRHCRASIHTILAVETTEGRVFGSFTSQPWRLASRGFYGSGDSFVWRMRKSRNEPCKSIVEQALMESKMDVFPFTYRNKNIQFCTQEGICIGEGEVPEMSDQGTNYGNAIRLNGSLKTGSTSNSETFGNPCLTDTDLRGNEFEVANIELWALTPHSTIAAAERAELKTFFLEEGRHADKNLNLLEILVGTPAQH